MFDSRSFTSNRYEAKRQEIEAWLMRMESRSERMGTAEAQADVLDFSVLDSQQKEQKVRALWLKFMEKDSSILINFMLFGEGFI